MREAVELSIESVRKGTGPFGAVVVKDGRVIGRGHNQVASDNDPTAHAEVVAIREAARNLGDFSLEGCEMYASCEPCPMCLAAAYWARLDRVYFANTTEDAAEIGFDDQAIYREVAKPAKARNLPVLHLEHPLAKQAFEEWSALEEKVEY